METIKVLSNSVVKHGVLAIIFVGKASNPLDEKCLFVVDNDDRGRGDGRRRIGLPGGGIEINEKPHQAIIRELDEEVALIVEENSLEQFGCYQKKRPNGFINDNHLFVYKLNNIPNKLRTNDPGEVSKVHLLSLREIISLSAKGFVHEGSIRLIVHYLNGVRSGSLNEPAILNGLIQF
jgi:8-oxo-dGTP pyrophosphatase MutT (NUDIX family)